MHDLILALRNASRNRRRSLVTIFALALCSAGMILFAGYVTSLFNGDEARTVSAMGHLQIFRHDFPEKGYGSPAAFRIDGHQELRKKLSGDPVLGPMIHAMTGQLVFTGLASNFEKNTSAAFVGFGVDPVEYEAFVAWNPHHLTKPEVLPINELLYKQGPWVGDDDITSGSLGVGLARVLEIDPPNLQEKAEQSEATAAVAPESVAVPVAEPVVADDLPNFAALEAATAQPETNDEGGPMIELLCSPQAGAAPNVQTLKVRGVRPFGAVELDDRLVLMHVDYASNLLFPGEPTQVTSLRLLLKDDKHIDAALARINEIIAVDHPELECRTWLEMAPFYRQITAFLKVIFVFMFVIIASIVVFTIYNTLAAAIVERTSEIGTLRAMGVNRRRVAGLFIAEAVFMGIAGGLLGVVLALVIGTIFNGSNILYNPPGTSFYMKVEVMVFRNPIILVYGFVLAVVTAVFSAILPAVHAARLAIIDALRHAG